MQKEQISNRWGKKVLAIMLVMSLVISSIGFSGIRAYANPVPATRVSILGHIVDFEGQPPLHTGGRVFVPVRGVFTLMGFEPEWHQASQTATLFDGVNTIVITVGASVFTVNGRVISLQEPARNMGGRILIPLRAVAEAVGGTANWDGDNRIAVITPPFEMVERTLANINQVLTGATPTPTPPPGAISPDITTTILPAGNVSQAYSQTLAVIGTAPITWGIATGSLPPGLTLNASTGVISGTPTTLGTFNFVVRAQNAAGSHVRALSIEIGANQHTITFNPNGGTGSMAQQIFQPGVAQALRANAFTRTGHTFTGWATSPTGAVVYTNNQSIIATTSRTLYAVWASGFTITFMPNGGTGTMQPQTFQSNVAQNLSTNTFTRAGFAFVGWATTPTGAVAFTNGQNITNNVTRNLYAVWTTGHTVTFNANGGTGTMVPQVFQTDAAQNLTANTFTRANHTFVGWSTSQTATTPMYTNQQSIINNSNRTLFAIWSTGVPVITTTSLPNGTTGMAYTTTNLAAIGTAPIIWTHSTTAGTWPPGLTLNSSTGVLSGTPTQAGTFNVTIWASNALGHGYRHFTIVIAAAAAPVISGPNTATTGHNHLNPGIAFTATGTAPITWSISAGALPPGMNINPSTGLISGTATALGTFNFTIMATNAAGSNTMNVTITVMGEPTLSAGATTVTGVVGVPITPVTWTAVPGANNPTINWTTENLPPGLTFTNGILAGTPTTAGTFALTIRVGAWSWSDPITVIVTITQT